MIESEAQARSFVAERCDEAALERLDTLAANLREENQRQNLVSKGTLEQVWTRHIADSAQLLDHVTPYDNAAPSRETGFWLDLGSGAGFPGLVVAAMEPDRPVVLVESRRKRIEWLQEMARQMRLNHCEVAGTRLELLENRKARVISARAFAPLEKLLRLSARFSTDATEWVLPKGRSAAQELHSVSRKWHKLFHVEQSITDPEAAILVGRGKA